jgi:TetR/AcrR family transcriptional repressor of nem operon
MQRREADTRSAVLDVAERLVQTRGFNGFSYADVAEELGLTKAALHYHFRGKAELGEALVVRYATRFAEELQAIDEQAVPAPEKLHAYADLYLSVLRDDRMCLCGMLAAEFRTLPAAVSEALVRFFDDNVAWLEKLLAEGRAEGTLRFGGDPADAAQLVVGALEGAMLLARPYGDPGRFEAVASRLVEDVRGPVS